MTIELAPYTLDALARIIHDSCGLVIGQDKAYLVRHRLEPVMNEHGLTSFEQLLQRLRGGDSKDLHEAVIDAITTQETSFFRDPALFDAIHNTVFPERIAAVRQSHSRGPHRHIRIWSAAASTGQEIYSIAMLVREFAATHAAQGVKETGFSLIASDISARAIDTARAGQYTKSEISRGLSDARLDRYFHRSGNQWQVEQTLRDMIRFQRFNLLDSPENLGLFDLVLCRNVLIYFDEPTRRRVCKGIIRVLHQGGWLALGSAENLYGIEGRYQSVKCGNTMLYRAVQAS